MLLENCGSGASCESRDQDERVPVVDLGVQASCELQETVIDDDADDASEIVDGDVIYELGKLRVAVA